MRHKNLVPRGTPLWFVYVVNNQPRVGLGFFHEVDDDLAILTGSLPFSVSVAPLHRCFFAEAGAKAYIRDVLGGGQACG